MKRRYKKTRGDGIHGVAKEGNYINQTHAKRGKKLKLLLVCLVLLAGLVATGLAYTIQQNSVKTKKAQAALEKAVNLKDSQASVKKIRSKLGFELSLNTDLLKADATILEQGGKFTAVTGDDLYSENDYAVVNVYGVDTGDYRYITSPELEVSTNINKDFFDRRRKEYGQNLSELELTVKHYEPKQKDNQIPELLTQKEVTINGYKYKKLVYKITDTKYFKTDNQRTTMYVTVQNGRPYAAKLYSSTNTQGSELGSLEQVIKSLNYRPPDDGAKLVRNVLNNHTSAFSLPALSAVLEGAVNTPQALEQGTELQIVAKNQPAVVRVGTGRCLDFNLLMPDKAVAASIKDACYANVGSGSIVSNDGYISTNGHVSRVKEADVYLLYLITSLENNNEEPIQTYFNYLINTGIMSEDQLVALLNAVKQGDQEAERKIIYAVESIPVERFSITKDQYQYAIQLSNEPIKVKKAGTRKDFVFTEKVVEAKYIDSNFDLYGGQGGRYNITDSTASDVAILKMEAKKNFPTVKIGSVTNLGPGSQITVVGFPAYVDKALETTKKTTIPQATQGELEEIIFDSTKNERKLLLTNVPGAPGNSGGPGFDKNGQAVGLITYGTPGCPADDCLGKNAVLRDVSDYQALLKKNKITINDQSETSQNWKLAIDEFSQAHYKKAVELFNKSLKQYPALYLAESLTTVANEKIKAGEDVSETASILPLIVLIILAVGIAVVVIALLKHKKAGKSLPGSPLAGAAPAPINPAGQTGINAPTAQNYPIQNAPLIPQYPQQPLQTANLPVQTQQFTPAGPMPDTAPAYPAAPVVPQPPVQPMAPLNPAPAPMNPAEVPAQPAPLPPQQPSSIPISDINATQNVQQSVQPPQPGNNLVTSSQPVVITPDSNQQPPQTP